MSCIYGTRQFGFEDQGWVAWFIIAALFNRPITIYGNGKQVRDLLYVTDLIEAYNKFIESDLKHAVFNIGGGPENTISLLEFLDLLEKETGKRSKTTFSDWRPSDQKVYISDISKVKKALNWEPKISPKEGMKKLISWVKENKDLF
jgi:CDP-paratose 2-epimerase